jgi:hypothetical protein
VEKEMESVLVKAYNDWHINPTTNLPRFLCLQSQYVSGDLANLDIPVFYHQLNTVDVMDSHGTTIQIPDTISINNKLQPVSASLKRNSFFPSSPINHVKNDQLIVLNSDKFDERCQKLREELQRSMQSTRADLMAKELLPKYK